MLINAIRLVWHLVLGIRRATRRSVRRWASDLSDAQVLELGSGPPDSAGRYPYSCAELFPGSCTVTRSDIDPAFGHRIVDCTTMEFDGEWDAILASNVLEHVYDIDEAVARIHKALKPGGRLLVEVPYAFPLHNEPIDFWRFTEHSLRKMFACFSSAEVSHRGVRRAPLQYWVRAIR